MISTSELSLESFPTGPLGCNCSIISSPHTQEAIIVDPGQDAALIMRKVAEKKLKVKYLLHTHAHFDHIADSAQVKAQTGAKLCLHGDDQFLYDALPEQGAFFGFQLPSPGKVDERQEDGASFGFSEVLDHSLKNFLHTLHTPGHTPGSCCFYMESAGKPVLFSGDTLFRQSIGRTDLPGGDFEQIVKSIKDRLYLKLPAETVVIPGHGPSTTLYQEKKSNPFVRG